MYRTYKEIDISEYYDSNTAAKTVKLAKLRFRALKNWTNDSQRIKFWKYRGNILINYSIFTSQQKYEKHVQIDQKTS